jgi:mono/diheme cytochrome c family protein
VTKSGEPRAAGQRYSPDSEARLTRGSRLAVGFALICAVIAGGAVALAWHPEIDPIAPPAPASFDQRLVASGEDLAKLGNCAGCHTAEKTRPLAGGRPMSTPFGKVFATNISPHREDGIGAWSREAFGRAMRRGIARDGSHLYPAFPYDHFTKVNESELDALYAWLMTRRPIAGRAPETRLAGVAGFRPLVAVWNLVYLQEGPTGIDLSQSSAWNRGRSLVEGLAHCGGCHTPRDRFGAEDGQRAFDGASIEGWYAPAINARSPAVRPWTADELYAYLRTGLGPMHAAAAGPMGNVTRALGQVPEADVRAIAVYVASLMAKAPAAQKDTSEPADRLAEAERAHPEAATLFAGACGVCHEPGAPMMQQGRPPLAWGTPLHEDNPQDTVAIIIKGLAPPAGAAGPAMPAFAEVLNDNQVRQLAAYLRARFTDKPPWNGIDASVAQARQGEQGGHK